MALIDAIKKLNITEEAKEETIKRLQEILARKNEYIQEFKKLKEIANKVRELGQAVYNLEKTINQIEINYNLKDKLMGYIDNIANEIDNIRECLRNVGYYGGGRDCLVVAKSEYYYYLGINENGDLIVFSKGLWQDFIFKVNLEEDDEEIAKLLYLILASS